MFKKIPWLPLPHPLSTTAWRKQPRAHNKDNFKIKFNLYNVHYPSCKVKKIMTYGNLETFPADLNIQSGIEFNKNRHALDG